MHDEIFKIGRKLRCPNCRGEEFRVQEEAEFKISGDEVESVSEIVITGHTHVDCEDCGFFGTADLFNAKIQDGMSRGELVDMVFVFLKRTSATELCKLATTLFKTKVAEKPPKDPEGGDEEPVFILTERDLDQDKKGAKK